MSITSVILRKNHFNGREGGGGGGGVERQGGKFLVLAYLITEKIFFNGKERPLLMPGKKI